MTERITTKLPKWPFLLGDISLLALAGFIVYQSAWPLGLWQIGLCLAAVALGAALSVIPFLQEFRVATRLAEAHALSTAMAQIEHLETIQNQIAGATGQWTTIQEHSARTTQAAKELAERFKNEAQEICAFFEKANDREKAHLRLEVEKQRRSERDWLQVAIHILDHVFALHQAAARSGQPRLISQLAQFQQACRETVRRLGLVAFGANPGDAFDSTLHQTGNQNEQPPSSTRIASTVAAGFTFQGQLVRRALVELQPDIAASGNSATPDPALQENDSARGDSDPAPVSSASIATVAPSASAQEQLSLE